MIDRSTTRDTPLKPEAVKGRSIVRNSRRGNHLGQRSCTSAFKGRTYGRKRSDQNRLHDLARRAPSTYDRIVADMDHLGQNGDLSAARLHSLGQQRLTYIRSNGIAIVNYGARYRSGQRVATSLAESAVNSLVAKRMVKNQQMRWSQRGAHLMLQVRAAMTNGNLRERLLEQPNMPTLAVPAILQPTPPLLRAA